MNTFHLYFSNDTLKTTLTLGFVDYHMYPFTYNCYFALDSSGTKISPKNLPNPYGVKMREWGARIIVGKQHNWHLHKCMAH